MQWIPNTSEVFIVASAVKDLRIANDTVDWGNLLWGKNYVPRFDFIMWMLYQRRLTTKDRMLSWEMTRDMCEEEEEAIEHL